MMRKAMNVLSGLFTGVTLLMTSAHAHHTYTHQAAENVRLFSIQELQFLVLMNPETDRGCAYLIPRRNGTRQYGVLVNQRKECSNETFITISRDQQGRYAVSPVKGKKPPPFLIKPVVLEPVSGDDYTALRDRLAAVGLTPAMTQEQVDTGLGKLDGFERRKAGFEFEMANNAQNSGFFGEIAEFISDKHKERVTVISHETGADGHFSSPENSVVAINRRKQVDSFTADPWEPTADALKAKYGPPSLTKTENWPTTDKLREVLMIWALDTKGNTVPNLERYHTCGASKLGLIRVSEKDAPEKSVEELGKLGFDMHHVDIFEADAMPDPGECVMFLEVVITVSLEGKLFRIEETVTDSGLMTDIYTKSVFNAGRAFTAQIKVPK